MNEAMKVLIRVDGLAVLLICKCKPTWTSTTGGGSVQSIRLVMALDRTDLVQMVRCACKNQNLLLKNCVDLGWQDGSTILNKIPER